MDSKVNSRWDDPHIHKDLVVATIEACHGGKLTGVQAKAIAEAMTRKGYKMTGEAVRQHLAKLRNKDGRTSGPGSGSSGGRPASSRAKGAAGSAVSGSKRKYTNKAGAFEDEDVLREVDYTYDADVPDSASKRAMKFKQDDDDEDGDDGDEVIEVDRDSFPASLREKYERRKLSSIDCKEEYTTPVPNVKKDDAEYNTKGTFPNNSRQYENHQIGAPQTRMMNPHQPHHAGGYEEESWGNAGDEA